jgi:N-acetylneuraminic acid mutarotase
MPMKRLIQVVILLLVITFLPVLFMFSFSTGAGPASALKPKPTPSSGGTWTLTGSLLVARYGIFTATSLQKGQVLVAGGYQVGTGAVLAEAELYTPYTGKWTTTGSMNDTREDQTATLLPNWQVFVAGGNDGKGPGGYTASAELYTPSTGTWTSTDSMNLTRDLARATLLQSGKVLVAGGENYTNGPLSEAELYDPSTGTWTTTGSMNVTRIGPTATLLQNGQVLVVGGNTGTSTSAELYDPSTGKWTLTGSLNIARYHHTATLLSNGQVLVVGGNSSGPSGYTTSAESYTL